MTGTAATESPEFSNIYNLAVTVVPTNQTVKRSDESDVVFRTEEGKLFGKEKDQKAKAMQQSEKNFLVQLVIAV